MSKRILSLGLITLLAASCALVLMPRPAMAAEIKIGVVDIQRILEESEKGKDAKAKLVKKFEKMQSDLTMRENELEKMKTELERQGSVLAPDVRYEKEKTFQRKMRDFEDLYRDYQEVLQREQFKSTQPLLKVISEVLEEYGKKGGYTVILERQKSAVMYVPEAFDITPEIIKIFDAKP